MCVFKVAVVVVVKSEQNQTHPSIHLMVMGVQLCQGDCTLSLAALVGAPHRHEQQLRLTFTPADSLAQRWANFLTCGPLRV